ncbi:helix-turn-helix transcriptional regulator [Rhodococcus marinonascens]|uniref:helix-turn-helix transcriptional regulator n=1 Tax=Rhodococcus marinonascens TaxID=38311 RepID=UPI00093531CF|nr:hypothetical protein [Rhodococcus marinonascens]
MTITARNRCDLATPVDLARYLQRPVQTLAMWRARRKGPRFIKLENGHIRYRWNDIDSWLDAQVEGVAA